MLFPVPWRYWSLPRHLGRRRTLGDLYTSRWGQGGPHRDFLGCPCVVHVGWLCMCQPSVRAAPAPHLPRGPSSLSSLSCSSHVLFRAQKLQFLLFPSTHNVRDENCSRILGIAALVPGITESPGVGASRWGQERRATLVLLDVTGHSLLGLLCMRGWEIRPSQKTNPGNGDAWWGYRDGQRGGFCRQIFPQMAFTHCGTAEAQAVLPLCFFQRGQDKVRERGGWMDPLSDMSAWLLGCSSFLLKGRTSISLLNILCSGGQDIRLFSRLPTWL